MNLKFLTLSLTLLSASAFATNPMGLRLEISNLAQEISFEVRNSNTDFVRLGDIRDQLSLVLGALKQESSPSNRQDCLDFAFEKYALSHSSNTAMSEAIGACQNISELEIAKYVFEKSYLTLSAAGAMDVAARYANQSLRNKSEILEFAYEAYYRNLSSAASISLAAEKAAIMDQRSLGCLRFSYERRSRSVSSSSAMNQAFEDCR